jgi:hypothetical protein
LHSVLWSTYLGLRVGVPSGPCSLMEALVGLDEIWDGSTSETTRRHLPAVGTALWNLLPLYQKRNPPKEFSRLLLNVLMLELDEARQLLGEPAHGVIPPLRSPLIRESSFTRIRDNKAPGSVEVRLEACVGRDFDDLAQIVDPENWPTICPLFWVAMQRHSSGWTGRLRFPMRDEITAMDVVLHKGKVDADPRKIEADIGLVPKGAISGANLHFTMYPEPSSPGWTRMIQTRRVTFPASVPAEYRWPTMAYWSKSELACLALN